MPPVNVAFFVTCLADQFYPGAAIAAVRLLERLGCTVRFDDRQTCCGQPLWNNGFRSEARRLAERMLEVFEQSECVVTPSGSCAAMVRDYYGDLFAGDPDLLARAKALADRTYELVEFLFRVLEIDPAALGASWSGGPVTYHPSCHLRLIGLGDEVERLLRAVKGLDYRPLEDADLCCGFGGLFTLKYPWISGPMGRDKVEAIRATGAGVVVSNDAGCTMQLSGACRRAGLDVRFLHIAELLHDAQGGRA